MQTIASEMSDSPLQLYSMLALVCSLFVAAVVAVVVPLILWPRLQRSRSKLCDREVKTAVNHHYINFILTACKAVQVVDCGAEALMVPGTEAATLPVGLEPQGAREGWHWKRLRLEDSVQAQDQRECNNEMAALPQVCVSLHLNSLIKLLHYNSCCCKSHLFKTPIQTVQKNWCDLLAGLK